MFTVFLLKNQRRKILTAGRNVFKICPEKLLLKADPGEVAA